MVWLFSGLVVCYFITFKQSTKQLKRQTTKPPNNQTTKQNTSTYEIHICQVAFNAYKNATKEAELPNIDGLTADQRFFLAYAGVWAGNITEAEIRNRTKSDPHSLGEWRVNGALPHIDAWYEAFNVNENDKMYIPKEKRLNLW